MEYLLLIYADEKNLPPMEGHLVTDYKAFNQALGDAGVFRGANRLHSVTTATTIAIREGRTVVSDGPFAETKEQLAGYYLLECESLDEAIGWAERMPAARIGRIEVRPVQ